MKINNCLYCGSCVTDIVDTGRFNVVTKKHEVWYVFCVDCNARGSETRSREDAIAIWNRDFDYFKNRKKGR